MSLIITLIVLGVIFYFIGMLPMAEPFPSIIRAVAVIIAIILVLGALGFAVPLHIN
jgi:VIT1/CCC1 family predicted Fe2+/Mn2+ transporter